MTIFITQLKELGGLHLSGGEPEGLPAKLMSYAQALTTFNVSAFVLGVSTAAVILGLRRWKPTWPGMLIAVSIASIVAAVLHLPIETIGGRFGGMANSLPSPAMPKFSWPMLVEIFPTAVSFTLLGGIESLLSAKIADGMTGRRHRSNMELVAQGIANIGSALFGGISVTGTIARTATNIRAGARSPFAGMMHSAFLLVFILIAAPAGNSIPLAALAGVLVAVCWGMIEKEEVVELLRAWQAATVLLVTFAVTLVENLVLGIVAGCLLAAAFSFFGKPMQPTEGKLDR